MITIIIRTLRDKKNSIFMFIGTGVGLLWMYVAMFPIFQKLGTEMIKIFSSIEGMADIFPITEEVFQSIENFLAMEQYSLMLPILLIFLLIGLASTSLSGDVEEGTVEILLARPISRLKLFFGRYLAGIIVLILFVGFTSLMIIPFGKLHNLEYNVGNFLSISVILFLFGWVIFSCAMMVSAIYSEKNKVTAYVGGMVLVMYIMQIIASTNKTLDFVQYLSFFYYYDYKSAILQHSLATSNIMVFSIVAIVTTIFGAWWYYRRDIAV